MRRAAWESGARAVAAQCRKKRALAPPAWRHSSAIVSRLLSGGKNERKVEDLYQRKDPISHVLERPQMYVGNVEQVEEAMYLFTRNGIPIEEITYTPAMVKLFDEILVNAADNAERESGMTAIRVEIDQAKKTFAVENDGKSVPVVVHKGENLYVPELVFGHLLTGSNFDDSMERYTGGRHGYGAKLTNIMSQSFTVETLDLDAGMHFKMKWADHMKPVGSPIVTPVNETNVGEILGRPWKEFTRVEFIPDLKLFPSQKLDRGSVAVMTRRVYDIAGILASKGVSVHLNNKQIKIRSFADYCAMVFKSNLNSEEKRRKMKGVSFTNDSTDLYITTSPNPDSFVPLSFVNCIATNHGGTHLDYATREVVKGVTARLQTKLKGSSSITPQMVKKHLAIFLSTRVPNPTFDSQTKDRLTSTIRADHGLKELPDELWDAIIKQTDIVDRIGTELTKKDQSTLNKAAKSTSKVRVLLNIPKLEDAVCAGTKDSQKCTLILTEGDSAKSLAVSGLGVVGREHFGVFPLRGKLLNVRDASTQQIVKNEEISNLVAIMGLQYKTKYQKEKDLKSLRYGRIMIMTDQDYDGSHIKGLIINFFHHFWPELLQHKGFLAEFVTPLIKVRNSRGVQHSFFTIPEYELWTEEKGKKDGPWSTKYYKGLGTSTSAEAKEYFRALQQHTLTFVWPAGKVRNASGKKGPFSLDTESPDEWISMAFSNKRAEDRRSWLEASLKLGNDLGFVDHSADFLSYKDFVKKELVLFSQHDTARSIPSMVDGLKPSQRKVLFSAFKRGLDKEVKVGQLAGFCSEQTAYHHGEASLHSTITNMAQDFVGSNNLPLLVPSGQFGTRLQGGKDAASARYIFTLLQPYSRLIFPKSDDQLLLYNVDDGQEVEPTVFVPILPMILVNGAEGIGTGWSTSIPSHNPIEIIDTLLKYLHEEKVTKQIKPWYRRFKGDIKPLGSKYSGGFSSEGKIEFESDDSARLIISELPIGMWTEDFKTRLNNLASEGTIISFEEHHTENDVLFKVEVPEAPQRSIGEWATQLRLSKPIRTTNMHLFNAGNCIHKYTDPLEIIREFYVVRLNLYAKRKTFIMDQMERSIAKLENQVKFTQAVCTGALVVTQKTKKGILDELESMGFASSESFLAKDSTTSISPSKKFDYLLDTPLWDLTAERIDALKNRLVQHKDAYEDVKSKTPEQMWERDLLELKTQIIAAFPGEFE